jgi:hypothetical protein
LLLKTGWGLRQKYAYAAAAWLSLHLLLTISFACRDTFRVVAEGPTILPISFRNFSQKAEAVISAALCQKLRASNPMHEALNAYVQLAGIETGYGYFAPNVPGSYALVFELHYPDGRVEYKLPSVSSAAAGLRIAGLLDNIGRTPYDALREILVKTVAQSIWRQHPDAESVRAIVGSIRLPTVSQFEAGKRESYEFLYAYDFSLENPPAKANRH